MTKFEIKRPGNLYAVDGKCHNANHGTGGHECGKPATWVAVFVNAGHVTGSGFCDDCKEHGYERHGAIRWERRE